MSRFKNPRTPISRAARARAALTRAHDRFECVACSTLPLYTRSVAATTRLPACHRCIQLCADSVLCEAAAELWKELKMLTSTRSQRLLVLGVVVLQVGCIAGEGSIYFRTFVAVNITLVEGGIVISFEEYHGIHGIKNAEIDFGFF